MSFDPNKMTDDQLMQLLNENDNAPATVGDKIANTIGAVGHRAHELAHSASTGIVEGVTDTAEKTTLFLKEMMDLTGVTSAEETEKFKARLGVRRQKREERLANLSDPTVGKVGKFVGETAPFLATGAGGLARLVGTGAGIGAIQDEENRVRGAAIGGATAGALGAAGRGVRKLMPSRSKKVAEAFRQEGIKPTRSQLIGKDTVAKQGVNSLEDKAKAFISKEDLSTHSEAFEKLLINREQQAARVADKLITKAFKGDVGKAKFNFKEVKEQYGAIREVLADHESTVAKTALKTLDKAFSKPMTLKEAKNLTIGSGRLSKQVDQAFKDAKDIAGDLMKVRNTLREGMESRLQTVSPNAFNKFKSGVAASRKKIVEIDNKDITKLIKAGDFDSITTSLTKSTGRKNLARIKKALGPKGNEIMEAGLVKNAFKKSFDKFDVFDSVKFSKTLDDITKSSGLRFNKDLSTFIDNTRTIAKSLKTSPQLQFSNASNALSGPENFKAVTLFKIGINKLLNSRAGIKLTTTSKFKSPDDVRARKFLDNVIKAGISAGLDTEEAQFNAEGMSDAELLEIIQKHGIK